jgi:thiol-disulfide isomerase/thioredoxin
MRGPLRRIPLDPFWKEAPRMLWKLVTLLAALALAFIASGEAAVPPVPPDLGPKPWKPDPEMRRLQKQIEETTDIPEQVTLMETVGQTLEKHPDWVDLHRNYIGLAMRTERLEEAKTRYREKLAQDSTNADLQYLNGILEQGAGGEPYHRRALAIDPNHYHARVALALALLSEGPSRYEEAFQDLFDAVRAKPDHPYGFMALTLGYQRIVRDPARALQVIEMWKKVQPDSAHPLQFEVSALLGSMKEAEAMKDTLLASEKEAEATKAQIRVAEMLKENGEQAVQAARLLAKSGDTAEAMRWLKEAVDRGYDDPRSPEADGDLKPLQAEAEFREVVGEAEKARLKDTGARRENLIRQLVKKPAPGFAIKTLEGEDVSLEGLRGKVVVLDFWATWCGPCRMTLPLVRNLHKTVQDKADVEILCMNVWERDPDRAKVAPYWKENSYPMKVGLASGTDASSYGVSGIPTLFVIDRQGQIRYQHVGYAPYMDEEVTWVVEALLAEPESN